MARSADSRYWGPRFFPCNNPESSGSAPPLKFGSVSLWKSRRPKPEVCAKILLGREPGEEPRT